MLPGTLWRRALRRVDRRTAALRAARADEVALPCYVTYEARREAEALQREAVRLSNRLAVIAGITTSKREAPRWRAHL